VINHWTTMPVTHRKVSINNPQPEQFDIRDISAVLSVVPRWGGTGRPVLYVGQHCCMVERVVGSMRCSNCVACLNQRIKALTHDGQEAVVGDCIRPLKILLPDYQRIEGAIELAICQAFGVSILPDPLIKWADNVVAATERRDTKPWDLDYLAEYEDFERVTPLPEHIVPWSSVVCDHSFVRQFAWLNQRRMRARSANMDRCGHWQNVSLPAPLR
jgi:hypothetical protein